MGGGFCGFGVFVCDGLYNSCVFFDSGFMMFGCV